MTLKSRLPQPASGEAWRPRSSHSLARASLGGGSGGQATPLLRGIFHVHTNASSDCRVTPEALIARCIDHGVDVLAVTDHNEIRGAFAVKDKAPFQVIVGEEIRCAEGGEIIGLFLTRRIERGLPARQVIAEIRSLGGLVYLPHPYDTGRSKRWADLDIVDVLLPEADIVEVFNARNIHAEENARAEESARRLGKAACAGADAHRLSEIGRTFTFLPPFTTPAELLRSLRAAHLVMVPAPWWLSVRKRLRTLGR